MKWDETDLRLLLWEDIVFTMDVIPAMARGKEICIAIHASWLLGSGSPVIASIDQHTHCHLPVMRAGFRGIKNVRHTT